MVERNDANVFVAEEAEADTVGAGGAGEKAEVAGAITDAGDEVTANGLLVATGGALVVGFVADGMLNENEVEPDVVEPKPAKPANLGVAEGCIMRD